MEAQAEPSRLFEPALDPPAVRQASSTDIVVEDVDESEDEVESGAKSGSLVGGGDADEEDVDITGFGALARKPARPSEQRRAKRSSSGKSGGRTRDSAAQDAEVQLTASGIGARAAAMRASGSHLSQRMPRQPHGASDGRRHRRKKNKGGVWTRSALESRASAADTGKTTAPRVNTHASLDLSRVSREAAELLRLSDDEGQSSGEESGRQEAGVFQGMLGGVPQPAPAKRMPFGTTATTYRRRGGPRAGGTRLRTPRDRATLAAPGGLDAAAVDLTRAASGGDQRCEPPAAGFTVLTDAQLGVLRQMFDAVDCGRKGWLGRDDVRELVCTIDDATELQRKGVDGSNTPKRSQCSTMESHSDSSAGTSRADMAAAGSSGSVRAGGAGFASKKQDSARGASSPTQAAVPAGVVSEAPSEVIASARATSGVPLGLDQAGIEEAEKKRRRDMRRLRKKEERVEKTMEELLKVLTMMVPEQSPQPTSAHSKSVQVGVVHGASGSGSVPSRMRLSFDKFSSAVDGALRRTETKCSGGDPNRKGLPSPRHSSGDLYCRKIVAEWPAAAAAAATAACWGVEPEPETPSATTDGTHSVSDAAEPQLTESRNGLSLLPPATATEETVGESVVRLLPSPADAAEISRATRRAKIGI